jgi:tRNA(Ile)-lysidine synthase
VRLRLYRLLLREVAPDLKRISSRHLREIDRLVRAGAPHASLDLPGGVVVARCYGELSVRLRGAEEAPAPYEFTVEGPGIYPLPGGGELRVSLLSGPVPTPFRAAEAILDPAKVPFPWLVRPFRPGDRFIPSGMTGSRKVKEFFIDHKVPRGVRGRIPLFFSGGRLIWVGGMRVSGEACADARSGVAIRAEIA